MGARTGQFRRTMRAKFGPAKAEKAKPKKIQVKTK